MRVDIPSDRIRYLLASVSDAKGNVCYILRFSHYSFRFRELTSVMDFLNMNQNIGYVENVRNDQ